jgi:hypothetical protein
MTFSDLLAWAAALWVTVIFVALVLPEVRPSPADEEAEWQRAKELYEVMRDREAGKP